MPGLRTAIRDLKGNGTVLGRQAREGESPVGEISKSLAGSRVPRDTGNPVGSRGDHPPKAKYASVTDSA